MKCAPNELFCREDDRQPAGRTVHLGKSSDSGGIRDDYIIDFELRLWGCGVELSQRSADRGRTLSRANAPATVPLVRILSRMRVAKWRPNQNSIWARVWNA